jgi:hypothetical protein
VRKLTLETHFPSTIPKEDCNSGGSFKTGFAEAERKETDSDLKKVQDRMVRVGHKYRSRNN